MFGTLIRLHLRGWQGKHRPLALGIIDVAKPLAIEVRALLIVGRHRRVITRGWS